MLIYCLGHRHIYINKVRMPSEAQHKDCTTPARGWVYMSAFVWYLAAELANRRTVRVIMCDGTVGLGVFGGGLEEVRASQD
jgi:hypothetical protein